MYLDCDKDALIYLGDPVGPSCHTVRHQQLHGYMPQRPEAGLLLLWKQDMLAGVHIMSHVESVTFDVAQANDASAVQEGHACRQARSTPDYGVMRP